MDELRLARRDGERGDQRAVGLHQHRLGGNGFLFLDDQGGRGGFEDPDLILLGVHHRVALGHYRFGLVALAVDRLDKERLHVRHDQGAARLHAPGAFGAVELEDELDVGVIALRHELRDAAVAHALGLGLRGAVLRQAAVDPFGHELRHDGHRERALHGFRRGRGHRAEITGRMAMDFIPRVHGEHRESTGLAVDHTGAEVRLIEENLEPHRIFACRQIGDVFRGVRLRIALPLRHLHHTGSQRRGLHDGDYRGCRLDRFLRRDFGRIHWQGAQRFGLADGGNHGSDKGEGKEFPEHLRQL